MARNSTAATPPVAESLEVLQLNPAQILREGNNARFSDEVSPAEAEAMKASILEVGRIMVPVGVVALPEPINGFTHRLRFGFRRVAGAVLANEEGAGITVPAIVLDDADTINEIREQVTENVQRKSLSLMDVAASAQRMLKEGMSRQDVRAVFTRPVGTKGGGVQPASNAWLNMVLGLLELPKAIQTRIHAGDIGLAAAYKLMKAPPEKRVEILDAAEKEQEKVRENEEREEKKFAQLESKIADATKKAEEAIIEVDTKVAEVELAAKSIENAEQEQKALYEAEQKAQKALAAAKKEQKGNAKQALKEAKERRLAAEKDAKDAASQLTAAQKALAKAKAKREEAEALAEENRKKLEAAQQLERRSKPKGDGKISPKAIEKAAKEKGVETGQKRLSGPEMRKFIEELSAISSYPKVAAIGQIIRECFDGGPTPGETVKKLATLIGETKQTAKKK